MYRSTAVNVFIKQKYQIQTRHQKEKSSPVSPSTIIKMARRPNDQRPIGTSTLKLAVNAVAEGRRTTEIDKIMTMFSIDTFLRQRREEGS